MQSIWNFVVRNKGYIILALIIALALKVFIPQLDQLKESLLALKDADLQWVALGFIVYFSGLPVLAKQYLVLALKRIPFWLTLKVQFAGLFVSKLLPSSLGTLSLNLYYLVQQKHTVVQSSTVMAMNAITSGIAYGVLIILALISSAGTIQASLLSGDSGTSFTILALIVLVTFGAIAAFYFMPTVRAKVKSVVTELRQNLLAYKSKPRAFYLGILLNGIGSFTSLFALYASAQALGVEISIAQALLAYTFGNIAAGLVPTPGGLGAAEAGIYSGLVLVGVDGASAISVTFLYRFISYWIPTIPGYIAFWSLRKDVLSKFSIKSSAKS